MHNAQAYKAYKPEFTLGLIGAILTIHTLLFSFAAFGTGSDALASFNILFSTAALVLGFAGAAQLNNNNRNGGALLTVAGGLSVLAVIFSGVLINDLSGYDEDAAGSLGFALFHAIIAAALLLPGGIMALVRKRPVPPVGMAAQPWPYPGSYPGQPYFQPPYAAVPGMPPYPSPSYVRPNPQPAQPPYSSPAPFYPSQAPYASPTPPPQNPAREAPQTGQTYDKVYEPEHYHKNP